MILNVKPKATQEEVLDVRRAVLATFSRAAADGRPRSCCHCRRRTSD